MGRKPQSVPELSSALDWVASLSSSVAHVRLVIFPDGPGGTHAYAGAELHVRCPDGGVWCLERACERVSSRSDSTLCGAAFRGAIRLRAKYEDVSDADLIRLAEWERGVAKLRGGA